jgi:hypothetical protein
VISTNRLLRQPSWFWLLLAALATASVLYLTRLGPGAGGDSTSYLMGAENLLLGNGFSRYSGGYEIRPITGFPPVYSVSLAAAGLTGLELIEAARLLNAVLFGANVVLTSAIVYSLTRSTRASVLAGLLFLTRTTLLELHSWVMSEPLFIFLSLVSVCLIGRYLHEAGVAWLIAAGTVTALACLTRYVGVALVGTGLVGIALFGPSDVRRRGRDGLIFTGLSLIPLLMWLARNRAVAGTAVNRGLSYHPMEPELVRLFLADISSWFVPHQVPLPTGVRATLAIVIAAAVLGGLVALLGRRWLKWDRTRLLMVGPAGTRLAAVPWLLALYAAGGLFITWLNSTLLDAATTAAAPSRYLAPVFAASLILFVSAAVQLLRLVSASRRLGRIAAAAGMVLLAFYIYNSLGFFQDPLPRLGYTGRKLLSPELVAALGRIPAESPIVSNNPELIYVLVGRPAYVRPIHYDPYQAEYRDDYELQFAQLEDQLGRAGVFVVFDELEADDREVIDRLDLELIQEYPTASIYGRPEAGMGRLDFTNRSLRVASW